MVNDGSKSPSGLDKESEKISYDMQNNNNDAGQIMSEKDSIRSTSRFVAPNAFSKPSQANNLPSKANSSRRDWRDAIVSKSKQAEDEEEQG